MIEDCYLIMSRSEKARDLVSIILPVYKVELYIEACIQSVIEQSYKNIELILIDDVGRDCSIDIAKKMLEGSSISWRVITNDRNRGLSYCRNVGLTEAHGEYIFFLDSDDYISKDCIDILIQEAKISEADMVFGSFVYDVDGDIQTTPWSFTGNENSSSSPLHLYIRQYAFVMACNRLINKKFYDDCRVCFKEGIVHEDEPWSFSLIIRAKRISFVKQITYYYRKHQGSITAQKLDEFRLRCQFDHLRNCSDESFNFPIWKNKEFKTWYARLIFHFCTKVINSKLSQEVKRGILDRVFSELRIPNQEMNEIFFFKIAKKMSLILPDYRWLILLVKIKKIKEWLAKFA